jgi:hypothetical protein
VTKQEVQQAYGQSIYEIQMSIATRAFALMVANRPIPEEFGKMAVTALNAGTEFAGIVLGNPGPVIEPQGDRMSEEDGEPERARTVTAGHPDRW